MSAKRTVRLVVESLESRWLLSAVTPLPGDASLDGQFDSTNLVSHDSSRRATRTDFDGTSIRIAVDPGVPTLAGPNLHIREFVSTWHDEASDERLTGLTTIYVKLLNLNADDGTGHLPNGAIPLSGSYKTEVGTWGGENGDEFSPTGEVWQGTWAGKTNESFRIVGHGSGGRIEGLEVRLTFAGEPSGAVIAGHILDPGRGPSSELAAAVHWLLAQDEDTKGGKRFVE